MIFGWKNDPRWVEYYEQRSKLRAERLEQLTGYRVAVLMNDLLIKHHLTKDVPPK